MGGQGDRTCHITGDVGTGSILKAPTEVMLVHCQLFASGSICGTVAGSKDVTAWFTNQPGVQTSVKLRQRN